MDEFIVIEVIAFITVLFSGTILTIIHLKKPAKKDDLNERLKSIEDRIYALQLQCDQIAHQEDEIIEIVLNMHDHLIGDDE